MKYGKTLLIAALMLGLQQAASATEAPANALSAEEASLAFAGSESALQVAALSTEEMEKTEGAYLPYQALTYLRAATYMPRSYGGASQVGLSLIGYSMSKTSYAGWGSAFTSLAYNKMGGYFRADGK